MSAFSFFKTDFLTYLEFLNVQIDNQKLSVSFSFPFTYIIFQR